MISKDFQPRRWLLPTRLTRRIAFVLLPSPRQLSSYGSDMEDLVSWRKWWHHFKWWLNRHNPPKMNVKHFGFISTYPIVETQVDQLIAIFLLGRNWWASLMIMWIYVTMCHEWLKCLQVGNWIRIEHATSYYISEQWRMRYRETTKELAHRAVIFGKKWLWCTQHQSNWVLQEIPATKELMALRGLVK